MGGKVIFLYGKIKFLKGAVLSEVRKNSWIGILCLESEDWGCKGLFGSKGSENRTKPL